MQLWRRYLNPRGGFTTPCRETTSPCSQWEPGPFIGFCAPLVPAPTLIDREAHWPSTRTCTSRHPHRVSYDGKLPRTFFGVPPLRLYTRPNGDLPIRKKKVGRVEPLKWSHLRADTRLAEMMRCVMSYLTMNSTTSRTPEHGMFGLKSGGFALSLRSGGFNSIHYATS